MSYQPAETAQRLAEIIATYSGPEIKLRDLFLGAHDPDIVAFRIIGEESTQDLTYGQLDELSGQIAIGLAKQGISAGDCVAVLMGKSARLVATLVAIWRIGGIVMPIFTAFSAPAIAYRLEAGEAKLVIADAGQAPKLDEITSGSSDEGIPVFVNGKSDGSHHDFGKLLQSTGVPDAPGLPISAPMIRIFTSGTTGAPKGVDFPLRALASVHAYAEFGLHVTQDDVYWCAADPGWAYGLYYAVLAPLLLGKTSILLEGGFDPSRTMHVLASEGVTNYAAAPTIYRALRDVPAPADLCVRKASSAGEPLGADLDQWTVETFGVPIHDHYGQTEAGMMVNNHHHPALRNDRKPGSMGRAMPGWSAVVLDDALNEVAAPDTVGKLAMRLADSPLSWFEGYLGDTEKTSEKFSGDGQYYLTGDTARIDKDGLISFFARDDDIVLMAGYRIGPQEVESVLNEHPRVASSAAFGVPDPKMGERLEACVVIDDGEPGDETARELQDWVKDRFARHAYPRRIHFAEELPLTPSGKVKRFAVKERYLKD